MQHPGHKAFIQYLTELDEAFDIIVLTAPKALTGVDNMIKELLGKRILIRELLHMFKDLKNPSNQNKEQRGQ